MMWCHVSVFVHIPFHLSECLPLSFMNHTSIKANKKSIKCLSESMGDATGWCHLLIYIHGHWRLKLGWHYMLKQRIRALIYYETGNWVSGNPKISLECPENSGYHGEVFQFRRPLCSLWGCEIWYPLLKPYLKREAFRKVINNGEMTLP